MIDLDHALDAIEAVLKAAKIASTPRPDVRR
jgi:hypothetical protein